MRSLELLLPLLAVTLLLASPAFAEDETAEVWTYRKGEETRELDVTSMSQQLRTALDKQMQVAGWKRQKAAATPPAAAVPEKAEPAAPGEDDPAVSEKTKRDIEELVRRGGRLPEGFVPHGGMGGGPGGRGGMGGGMGGGRGGRGGGPGGPGGRGMGPMGGLIGGPMGGAMDPAVTSALSKATGKLLLRYLEVKDDPVKGPVYEGVLRDLAQALVKGVEGPEGMQRLGIGLMDSVTKDLLHPEKGPVLREIMAFFSEAMSAAITAGMTGARPGGMPPGFIPGRAGRAGAAGQPGEPGTAGRMAPGAEEAAAAFADAPRELGGAMLVYMLRTQGGAGRPVVRLGAIPEGSVAASAGLEAGDRIEMIDGKVTDFAGLKRAAKVFSEGGKLTLRLRRTDGKVEIRAYDIAYESEAVADDR